MGQLSSLNNFSNLTFDVNNRELGMVVHDNFDYDDFVLKIISKEKDSELPIILKSLGILHNLDSSTNRLLAITTDFRTPVSKELSLILELKHTHQDVFSIPFDHLQEQIEFFDSLNLPLKFAISLNGYWGLFTPEQIEEKKCTLELSDFLGEQSTSWFDRELSTCSYMFENEIKIKSVFSHNHNTTIGPNSIQYGSLMQYEFYYDGKLIFSIDKSDSYFYAFQYVLRGLQDSVASINTTVEHSEDFTTIIESSKSSEFIIVPEYKLILPCLGHMLDEESKKSFDVELDNEKNPYICVRIIRDALSQLNDLGVDIIVLKDFYGYTFEKYKNMYWNNAQ